MYGLLHGLRLVYPVGKTAMNTFLGTVSRNDAGGEPAPRAPRVTAEARAMARR